MNKIINPITVIGPNGTKLQVIETGAVVTKQHPNTGGMRQRGQSKASIHKLFQVAKEVAAAAIPARVVKKAA